MAQQIGDGLEVTVTALIDVLLDPATQKTFAASAGKLGDQTAAALTDPITKSLSGLTKQVDKALGAASSSSQRQKIVADTQKSISQIVKAAAAGNEAAASLGVRVLRQVLVTAERTGQAARQAAASTAQATATITTSSKAAASAANVAGDGVDQLIASLQKIFPVTKGNEKAFESLANVIVAETNKAAKAISEGIVKEQSKQQQESILKQQRQIALQQEKALAREKQAILQASLREEEQLRQTANRSALAAQRSGLAQENAAFNSSLQKNLIEEKGFQQRRTALVRAGLDATRSLYKSLASGTTSVISGAYSLLRSVTKSGEDSLTAENKRGLLARKSQTEQLIQQTTASARSQLTASNKVQAQLQGGVLGAATGNSPLTGILGGVAIGAGGALGIGALVNSASQFESNTRVLAVLNEELAKSPALMEALRKKALDLGRDISLPGVSAADAAEAITALAKTGLPLQQSIDAAKGSLLLAKSTGVDFAESARTVGSTLQALGIDAKDATKVVDGFTSALRFGGGATFDELRQAQQQALLVFKGAFQDVEQPIQIMNKLNASLVLFSRNALRGSDAGTSLKRFIQVLPGVTSKASNTMSDALKRIGEGGSFAFDIEGRARTFTQSIDVVNRSLNALDPQAKAQAINDIFGTDAGRAAQVFVDTSREELNKLIRDISRSEGITEKLAIAQNQGLKAAADAFVSTIETIFIVAFPFINRTLGNVINTISGFIDKLVFDEKWKALRGTLLGIAAALTAVIAVKAGVEVIKLLGIALSAIATPAGLVITALAAVGGAIGFLLSQSEPLRQALGRVFDKLKEGGSAAASGPLAKIGEFFTDVRAKVERAAEVVGFFITLLIDDDIRKRFIEWQGLDPNVEKEGIFGWFLNIRKEIPKLISTVVDTFKKVVSFIGKVATDPAFDTFRRAVIGVATGLLAVAGAIKGIAAAKAGLGALKGVFATLSAFATPLGLVALVIGGIAAAFVVLYDKSKPFRDLVDGLVDKLQKLAGQFVKAIGPALDGFITVVSGAASDALAIFSDAFQAVIDFVGSEGFAGALTTAAEIVGSVLSAVATGFQKVVTFITALARTIKELGIFEGLRQGAVVAFGAITDLVGKVFGPIISSIGSFFSNIDWPALAITAATGIFKVFQAIGRAVGRFIGSDEFIATVLTALGVLAAAIGSAAAGLVTGLIDGLRKSDLGRKVGKFFSDTLGIDVTKVDDIGDFLGQAFVTGVTKAIEAGLAAANPVTLVQKLFTDPFGSALGAAVLVVQVLFVGKIVGLFVSGVAKIKTAIAGVKTVGAVLQGGLGSVAGSVGQLNAEAAKAQGTLDAIGRTYGPVAQKAAKAAEAVSKFGGASKTAGTETEKVAKNIDGQTAAIKINEAAARSNLGTKGQEADANSKVAQTVGDVKDKYVALAAAIAGGAVAGAGIGTALTADDPLGKISGITAAIGGIGTIAVVTAQVVASSGLAAGLLTGGIGLAVTAIVGAVTFLIKRKNDAKAAAEAVAQATAGYVGSFKEIINTTNGSRAKAALEFFKRLNDTGSDEFDAFRRAVDEFGFSFEGAADAVTGTEKAYTDWRDNVVDALDSVDAAIEAAKRRKQAIQDANPARDVSLDADFQAAQAELDLLRNRKTVLESSLGVIDDTRKKYEEAREVAEKTLLIEQNLKQIEEERKTVIEQQLDQRRTERDLIDEVTQKMRDLIDLEKGLFEQDRNRAERGAIRDFADTVLPKRNEDGTTTAAPGDLAGFFAGGTTKEADAAAEAIRRLQTEFAETAARAALESADYAGYVKNLGDKQASFVKQLITEGFNPDQANQIATVVFAPFQQQAFYTTAAVTLLSDEVATLGTKLTGLDFPKLTAEIDDAPARKVLNEFLTDPSEKQIPALLDMGIPIAVLEAFVANPTEKTLTAVVDATNAITTVKDFLADETLSQKEIDGLMKMGFAEETLKGFLADGVLDQKEIDAIMTQASTAIAYATIADLTKPETKNINISATLTPAARKNLESVGGTAAFGAGGYGSGAAGSAFSKYGRVVDSPMLTWVGEENRKEVIIPLTMPNRAAQLYQQSGLADVLARAGVATSPPATRGPAASPPPRATNAGGTRAVAELSQLVSEMQALRQELREDMDERRDNVFQIQGVQDQPIATAREVAATMRRRRRRG